MTFLLSAALTPLVCQAIHEATGKEIDYFTIDLDWKSQWQRKIKKLAALLKQRKISMHFIINGSGDAKSNREWADQFTLRLKMVKDLDDVQIDQLEFASWNKFPQQNLPVADPFSFMGLVQRILR